MTCEMYFPKIENSFENSENHQLNHIEYFLDTKSREYMFKYIWDQGTFYSENETLLEVF